MNKRGGFGETEASVLVSATCRPSSPPFRWQPLGPGPGPLGPSAKAVLTPGWTQDPSRTQGPKETPSLWGVRMWLRQAQAHRV